MPFAVRTSLFLSLCVFGIGACSRSTDVAEPEPAAAERLVLYTSLPGERVNAVAQAFRQATGVVVDFKIDGDAELIAQLRQKEHHPGADVLLISGAGHLASALDQDVLRPALAGVGGDSLARDLRDPDGYWVGLGVRAELIVYDPAAVEAAELEGYAELGDTRWLGKLCLERSTADRSRALIGALIATYGERDAERIVRGWRANLATSVFDEQQSLLDAVGSGQCAIGIVSSEQLASFAGSAPAAGFGAHAPAAANGGTFENVTAAGVSRHANDPELAREFVAWLLSADGQRALHAEGGELAVAEGVSPAAHAAPWAGYEASPVHVNGAGFNVPDAALLAERARYR